MVTWNTSQIVGFSHNSSTQVVTKNTGVNGWNDNYARSTDSATVGSEVIELTFTGSLTGVMLGFNKATVGYYNTNANDFSINMAGDQFVVYENGSSVFNTLQSADGTEQYKIKIELDGTVKYYLNGTLTYTSTNTASGTYYVDAHTWKNGNSSPSDTSLSTSSPASDSVNAHAHLKPLQVFRRQRDWF